MGTHVFLYISRGVSGRFGGIGPLGTSWGILGRPGCVLGFLERALGRRGSVLGSAIRGLKTKFQAKAIQGKGFEICFVPDPNVPLVDVGCRPCRSC